MLINLLIKLGKRYFKRTPVIVTPLVLGILFSKGKHIDKYIQKLPRIYMLGYWAQFGVRDYPLAFYKGNMPYVFYYEDYNGTGGNWIIIPITDTTTGEIFEWSRDGEELKKKCAKLNAKMKGEL